MHPRSACGMFPLTRSYHPLQSLASSSECHPAPVSTTAFVLQAAYLTSTRSLHLDQIPIVTRSKDGCVDRFIKRRQCLCGKKQPLSFSVVGLMTMMTCSARSIPTTFGSFNALLFCRWLIDPVRFSLDYPGLLHVLMIYAGAGCSQDVHMLLFTRAVAGRHRLLRPSLPLVGHCGRPRSLGDRSTSNRFFPLFAHFRHVMVHGNSIASW
jgi:hypothetical protein